MPSPPPQLKTATIEEIWWTDTGAIKNGTPSGQAAKNFPVQFNPQTLKVNFSNQKAGGDQPKGSSTQFVGKGVTKLTLELWFDITLAIAQGRVASGKDVRALTGEVAYFMAPQPVTVKGKKGLSPPGIRFHWGSFLFEGVMDSMDETLDLFSADGLPLRASVSISVSKQEIQYDPSKAASLGAVTQPGTDPLTAAKANRTLQQMASDAGSNNWQGIALANGIENPRLLAPGALVNLSADVSVSGSAQLGVDISASAGFSASAGVGVSAGASAGAAGGVQLGFAGGASASAGASVQGDGTIVAGGGFGGGV
ncbi:MAG TPA: peptidoglycan-binding protein [Candidatus Dormibacteraeota bacterium]|nr:peptidoglycan-binding protein [Candidatus Dormibacteraeota bacterium]